MPVFKDKHDREWRIALDAPSIREVRQACDGLDLARPDGTVIDRLLDDPCLLVDVLWVLCREQAQSQNISDVQFGQALVGDAIERAMNAMLAGIADFFPREKREVVLAIAEKNRQLRNLAMAKAMAKINDPALEDVILSKLDAAMDAEVARALTGPTSVTAGQAS